MAKSTRLSPKIAFTSRSLLHVKGQPGQGFEDAYFILRDESGISKEALLKDAEESLGIRLSSRIKLPLASALLLLGFVSVVLNVIFFFL